MSSGWCERGDFQDDRIPLMASFLAALAASFLQRFKGAQAIDERKFGINFLTFLVP